MRRYLATTVLMAGICLSGPSWAQPACAGPVEISDGIFSRFEKNGLLILEDGRAIKLEGIRLPRGAEDRAPSWLAEKALARAAELANSDRLTFTAIPPKQDRYDRVRAQAFAGDVWLQKQLLTEGLARVDLASDRGECAEELYAAESEARARRAGIWAQAAYAVRRPDNVGKSYGTFQVVEGRVTQAGIRDGRAYLNFGADWKTDFTVTVSVADMENFKKAGIDPKSYVDRMVRVRGPVQSLNGPMIEVMGPDQIEAIPE